jgi:hypothetical protein
MAWTNGPLTLFHGTTTDALGLPWPCSPTQIDSAVRGFKPVVTFSSRAVDFSQGFYTTTLQDQARQWANEGVRRLAARKPLVPAGAVVFEYVVSRNDLALADALVFVAPSNDYFNFVRHCRRFPGALRHDRIRPPAVSTPSKNHYDVVYGPVSLGFQRLVIHGADQVSFHDQRFIDRVLLNPLVTMAATRRNGIL